jgi:hypothetical protein
LKPEKGQTSTAYVNLFSGTHILANLMGKKVENPQDYFDLKYRAIRIWSDAHGIVSLYNSRVLRETTKRDREVLDKRIDDLFKETLASCTVPVLQ